jgi:hypothetical protein
VTMSPGDSLAGDSQEGLTSGSPEQQSCFWELGAMWRLPVGEDGEIQHQNQDRLETEQ